MYVGTHQEIGCFFDVMNNRIYLEIERHTTQIKIARAPCFLGQRTLGGYRFPYINARTDFTKVHSCVSRNLPIRSKQVHPDCGVQRPCRGGGGTLFYCLRVGRLVSGPALR